MEGWLRKFEKEFLKKPGEHLLEIGITGSGKTQTLYWLVDGLVNRGKNETIVWFDTGKSSEFLTLAKFKPLRLIIPETLDIDVSLKTDNLNEIERVHVFDFGEVWRSLDKHKINVISFEPFVLHPEIYTKIVGKLFTALIRLAHDYALPTPMTIIYDEFHKVAPGQGHGLSEKHYRFGSIIQLNIERLRSLKVRFVATSHGWTKIRRGVRSSFNWFICKRGANFANDQPKLQRFNPLFEKLQTDECVIVYPTKIFSDIVKLPKYEDGEELGTVRYIGVFEV